MHHSAHRHHHRLYFTKNSENTNPTIRRPRVKKNSQKSPPPPPLDHKQFPCECAVDTLVSPEKKSIPPHPRHLPYLSKDKKRQSTSRLPKNGHRSSPYDIYLNEPMIPAEIRPKKNISHFWASLATHPLISSSRALNRMGGHGVLLTPLSPVIPTQNNTGARRCALFIRCCCRWCVGWQWVGGAMAVMWHWLVVDSQYFYFSVYLRRLASQRIKGIK